MEKQVHETFNKPSLYTLNLKDDPYCLNGYVAVVKYKITVEVVEEPKEVYRERLQRLWDDCDNHHHWTPIKAKAKSLGIDLEGSPNKNRKK